MRIPGVSQAEWDTLPDAVRAFIEWQAQRIEALETQNAALVARCTALEARVAELEARLAKNSGNSHQPPSSDGPGKPNRTQSERRSSGKKPGGQPGHSGGTLRKSLTPDTRVRHGVQSCGHCQRDLSRQKPDSVEERQVFDLPPMQLSCEAHEREIKKCPGCGHENSAEWPGLLASESGAAIYGERFRALGVYLTQAQLLPYQRSGDLIEDLFGHRLSAGSLAEWTRKASDALADTDRHVADILANEMGSVHFDETGLRCEGKNRWLHSASNARLTHLAFHRRRGTEAIEEIGILPRFQGTAIHDRWKPYSQYSCSHGLCGAHLLRDCRFAWEEEKERWARSMHGFLVKTCAGVNRAREQGRSRFNGPTIERLERRYARILKAGHRLHASKNPLPRSGTRGRRKQRFGKNLIDALMEHRGSVLRFVRDFSVPFTNNQAERDIRMSKVKIKVSGCFRSEDGARQFCRIRGYLSTARKQGWNLLEALTSVFVGAPLQPAHA